MAEDDRERRGGGEELFEDLDKFFAPIHDVDWPEEGEEAAPAATEGEPGIPWREPARTETATETPGAAAEPRGDSRDTPGTAAGEEEPGGVFGGAAAEPPADAGPPTQELRGNEWEDLRGRFGRGEEDELEGRPADDPYSFMQSFLPGEGEGEATPEEGDRPELTVDDLRKAPEEYSELPGPRDEDGVDTVAAEAEAAEGPTAAEEAEAEGFLFGSEGDRPEAAAQAGLEDDAGLDVPEGAPVDTAATFSGTEGHPAFGEADEGDLITTGVEEPPPGGVEAAAEHFAQAIRQSGELPVISAEDAQAAAEQDAGLEPLEPGPDPFGDELDHGFEQPPPGPRTIKVGAADIGPSWQDPTSVEVTTEAEAEPAPPGGRNLPVAILIGLALAIVALGALAISKGAFTVVATVVVVVAQIELYAALRRRGFQPAVPLGLAFGVLVMAGAYLKGEAAMTAMLGIAVPFTFFWFMALPPVRRRNATVNIGMTLFPLVYVPFLAGFLLVTLAAPQGRVLMLSVIALAVGYDVAAFGVGSWFGERPLAPSISPAKTWEGVIGATLVIVLAAAVFLARVDPISTLMHAIGLAAVIAVFAPLGDLAESLLKRDLGVKDMGTVLPGHGGVLDRIDSLLFAAPAAFLFARIFLY